MKKQADAYVDALQDYITRSGLNAISRGTGLNRYVGDIGSHASTIGSFTGLVSEEPTLEELAEMERNHNGWIPGNAARRTILRRKMVNKKLGGKPVTVYSEEFGPGVSWLVSTLGGAGLGALTAGGLAAGYGRNDVAPLAGMGAIGGLLLGGLGGLAANGIGALSAGLTPTRTDREQQEYEQATDNWKNWIIPGRALFNKYKSLGVSNRMLKEYMNEQDKKKQEEKKKMKKESSSNMYKFEKIADVRPHQDYLRDPKYKFEKIAAPDGDMLEWTLNNPAYKGPAAMDALMSAPSPSEDLFIEAPIGYYTPKKESDNSATSYSPRMTPIGPLSINQPQPKQGPSPAEIRRMEQAAREHQDLATMDVSGKWLLGAKYPPQNPTNWHTDPITGEQYAVKDSPGAGPTTVLPDLTSMPYQEGVWNNTVYGSRRGPATPEQAQSAHRQFNQPVHGVASTLDPRNPLIAGENTINNAVSKGYTPETQKQIYDQMMNNPQMFNRLSPSAQEYVRWAQANGGIQGPRVPTTAEYLQNSKNSEIANKYRNQLATEQYYRNIDNQIAQQNQAKEQQRQWQAQRDLRDANDAIKHYNVGGNMNNIKPQDWVAMSPLQRGEYINAYNRQKYKELGEERQRQWNSTGGNLDSMDDFNKFKNQQLALWGNRWRGNGRSEEEIDNYIRKMYGYRLRDNGVDMSSKVPPASMAKLPSSVRKPMGNQQSLAIPPQRNMSVKPGVTPSNKHLEPIPEY